VQTNVPATAKSGKCLVNLAFGNKQNADCLVANLVCLRPHCHCKWAKRAPFCCVHWTFWTLLLGHLKGSFWTFWQSLPLVKGLLASRLPQCRAFAHVHAPVATGRVADAVQGPIVSQEVELMKTPHVNDSHCLQHGKCSSTKADLWVKLKMTCVNPTFIIQHTSNLPVTWCVWNHTTWRQETFRCNEWLKDHCSDNCPYQWVLDGSFSLQLTQPTEWQIISPKS